MDSPDGAATIAVARIARARGIRGEVIADYHTDYPQRFERVARVWVVTKGGRRERRAVEEAWDHNGRLVLKLQGIDTVDAATAFAGAWVELDALEAVALPEGTFYDHDLIGCDVESPQGESLGRVKEVMRFAGNHQLIVERGGHEYMIPARGEICTRVSLEERRIVVDLPDGLMDLNR